MKKLMMILSLLMLPLLGLQAQTASAAEEPTLEDYERYFEARKQMDFRNTILEELDLTKEQIIKIDPLLSNYMNERVALAERKLNLIEDYLEEMKEDDRKSDEAEETSDFIENYWETSIREMKLKETYFDLFENKIPYQKALAFFFIEDDLQYQIIRPELIKIAPIIIRIESMSKESTLKDSSMHSKKEWNKKINTTEFMDKKLKNEKLVQTRVDNVAVEENLPFIDANMKVFSNWLKGTQKKVALNHAYTKQGLYNTVAVLRSMNRNNLFEDKATKSKLKKVEMIADMLQDNWKSTKHADMTREAFMVVSEIVKSASINQHSATAEISSNLLWQTADRIDPDQLLTNQAEAVYDFFERTDVVFSSFRKALERKEALMDDLSKDRR